ncbi:hypothetical protein ACJ41O_011667 [Fusarium nematophilum]
MEVIEAEVKGKREEGWNWESGGPAGTIVGLSTAALYAIRVLKNDLGTIKDAPQAITDLNTELQNVQYVVESLQAALGREDRQTATQDVVLNANVEAALKACGDSCTGFHAELKELLKHSSDGKLSKRDRFNFGFLARDRVVAFANALNVCKSTLGLALNGANFIVALEQYNQLQVIAKRGPPETERSNADGNIEPEYDSTDLATDIEQGSKLMKGYQELLGVLQSKVEENRTRLKIGDVDMVDSKGAAGITNADGTEGHLEVDLGNVKADRSKVVVGYSKKVDFGALFS